MRNSGTAFPLFPLTNARSEHTVENRGLTVDRPELKRVGLRPPDPVLHWGNIPIPGCTARPGERPATTAQERLAELST